MRYNNQCNNYRLKVTIKERWKNISLNCGKDNIDYTELLTCKIGLNKGIIYHPL